MAEKQEVIDALVAEGFTEGQAEAGWVLIAAEATDMTVGVAARAALEKTWSQLHIQPMLEQIQRGDLTATEAIQMGLPEPIARDTARGVIPPFVAQVLEQESPGSTTNTPQEGETPGAPLAPGADVPDAVAPLAVQNFGLDIIAAIRGVDASGDSLPPDEDVIQEWLDNNQPLVTSWAASRDSGDVVGSVLAGIQSMAMNRVRELIDEFGIDVDTQTVNIALARYGSSPQMRIQAEAVREGAAEADKFYNDRNLVAFVSSFGYTGENAVKDYLEFVRGEYAASTSSELNGVSRQDDIGIWTYLEGDYISNLPDQDEAKRVSDAVSQLTEPARLVSHKNGKGFIMERDWQRVSTIDGFGEDNDPLTQAVFTAVTEAGIEDAGPLAGYVALIAKQQGILEANRSRDINMEIPGPTSNLGDLIQRQADGLPTPQSSFTPGIPSTSFDGGVGQGQRGTAAGASPNFNTSMSPGLPGMSFAAQGRKVFQQRVGVVAGEFNQALQRYGRPELALIAMYDPRLAEVIWNTGGPQTEEEALTARSIVGLFEYQELVNLGFNDFTSKPFVDALFTVRGTEGGVTNVAQDDPATLREAVRAGISDTLLRDATDDEINDFVGSIQGARRSSAESVKQAVEASINVFQGKSLTGEALTGFQDQFGVDPQSRLDEQIRNSKDYKALYAFMPGGVSEQDFIQTFRSKVGSVVGQDDVSYNLDLVRRGMQAGDPNLAGRAAFTQNIGTDQTAKNNLASLKRVIRGLV